MSELKPCPFCGGEDLEIDHAPTYDVRHPDVYEVHCVECGGRGGEGWTEAEAIAAWNTRAEYHGYEQAAIEAWESIKKWNTRYSKSEGGGRMSGICDKCRREPCRMRMDGLKICDLYEGGETNWELLFGTPERAARTLSEIKCGDKSCKGCPIAEPCAECDVMLDGGKMLHDALLEWLRGEAE